MRLSIDIEHVSQILREVGRDEVMSRWRQLAAGEIQVKPGNSLVTVADHAAEAALERRLTALLPGSLVVGEEGVAADPSRLAWLARSGPVWVVDPIDGTRAFAKGREGFDMMVALVVGGRPVMGIIHHPVSGDLFAGEQGSGAWLSPRGGARQRLARPEKAHPSELTGIVRLDWPHGDPRRAIASQAAAFHRLIAPSSAGRNYVRLLRGEADFLLNFSTNAWDHLPGLLLVSEMGFHYARTDGAIYDPAEKNRPLLSAPSPLLWRDIRDILLPDPAKWNRPQ